MNQDRLKYLLAKHYADTASAEEAAELSAFIREEGSDALFEATIAEEISLHEGELTTSRFDNIAETVAISHPPARRITWVWAAAAVLLVLLFSTWWINDQPTRHKIVLAKDSVLPGKTGAILTLGNGTTMLLDSIHNGMIKHEAGTDVHLNNGQLAYQQVNTNMPPVYNTMTTPNGRQFSLILPDGTKVWLNAASSIRFPTYFSGTERRVDITGEVYFEVAENAAQPFRVFTRSDMGIRVLGTHFNVSTYNNEPTINTTLLQGKIRVEKGNAIATLSPGQQARVKEGISVISQVNTDKVIAWKNGLFNFDGATLPEVMHQLERWYNIEVEYQGQLPDTRFVGEMEMNMPLADVLGIFSEMHLHFKMEEGHKLIVMP